MKDQYGEVMDNFGGMQQGHIANNNQSPHVRRKSVLPGKLSTTYQG